jgi:NAD(P)-dependent dehydrogenase (short-subunit alcohol dehydrogenase family)
MELKESVDLVLGAIKAIGKEIALGLAIAGAKVVLNYFDWAEELETLKKDFKISGQEYLILRINLLKTAAILSMIEKTGQRFGRLIILINNIERGGWPAVHGSYNQQQWDLEMETTLRGSAGYLMPTLCLMRSALCVHENHFRNGHPDFPGKTHGLPDFLLKHGQLAIKRSAIKAYIAFKVALMTKGFASRSK